MMVTTLYATQVPRRPKAYRLNVVLTSYSFNKKGTPHRCFPVNIAKSFTKGVCSTSVSHYFCNYLTFYLI